MPMSQALPTTLTQFVVRLQQVNGDSAAPLLLQFLALDLTHRSGELTTTTWTYRRLLSSEQGRTFVNVPQTYDDCTLLLQSPTTAERDYQITLLRCTPLLMHALCFRRRRIA